MAQTSLLGRALQNLMAGLLEVIAVSGFMVRIKGRDIETAIRKGALDFPGH